MIDTQVEAAPVARKTLVFRRTDSKMYEGSIRCLRARGENYDGLHIEYLDGAWHAFLLKAIDGTDPDWYASFVERKFSTLGKAARWCIERDGAAS